VNFNTGSGCSRAALPFRPLGERSAPRVKGNALAFLPEMSVFKTGVAEHATNRSPMAGSSPVRSKRWPREAEASVKNRWRKHETQSTQVITTGSLALTLSTQCAEGAGSDAPGTATPRGTCSRAAIRGAHSRGRRSEQTPPGGGAYNT
jgi:hypothetical protein